MIGRKPNNWLQVNTIRSPETADADLGSEGWNIMFKNITFFFIILVFALSGCQPEKSDHFAVYLLAQDIPTADLSRTDINQLILESQPLISSDDIVSYEKTTHTIELTQDAYTRIQQLFSTPVRVSGIPFVVCVGKERIYTGAFWTPLSSLSYDGVVIMQSFDTTATSIQITLGYPGQDFFSGNDPRSDKRIMDSLEQDNKLK